MWHCCNGFYFLRLEISLNGWAWWVVASRGVSNYLVFNCPRFPVSLPAWDPAQPLDHFGWKCRCTSMMVQGASLGCITMKKKKALGEGVTRGCGCPPCAACLCVCCKSVHLREICPNTCATLRTVFKNSYFFVLRV